MKDNRYTTVFYLLKENALDSFEEIFTYLPYTIAAKDIKVSNITMKKLVTTQFYDEEIIGRLADWIGCEKEVLFKLAKKRKKPGKTKDS